MRSHARGTVPRTIVGRRSRCVYLECPMRGAPSAYVPSDLLSKRTPPEFPVALIAALRSPARRQTVKLGRRTEAPESSCGHTISSPARGATTTRHGFLERLLGGGRDFGPLGVRGRRLGEIALSTVVSAGACLNESACAANACLNKARTGGDLRTLKGVRRILRIVTPAPSCRP